MLLQRDNTFSPRRKVFFVPVRAFLQGTGGGVATYFLFMKRWTFFALLLVCCADLRAGQKTNARQALETPSEASAPLIDAPLTLDDFAGMRPRPELRARLGHVAGFIQSSPSDGDAATEATEVWMAHTQATLYFVFLCHDHRPDLIRSHLARREDILNDDYVAVLLDSFRDRRTGVRFLVNPAGVQADASYSESDGNDYSYDTVWDSEGRRSKDGWMALVAIPFRSLRFRNGVSDWGIVLRRNLPRNSESSYWPRVAASVNGVLPQEATLHGIDGVTASHNLQINPYLLAQNERKFVDTYMGEPYFSARKLEGASGGEIKWVLNNRIVVDGTINPDFSDVESDAPQFTVNQRYPVSWTELRPFFLENANYFSTPITLAYTRTIQRPEFGIRTTGKLGRTNLGLFLTDDRKPGLEVSSSDALYRKHALISVGRVSEDFGKGSKLGVIYTGKEFGNGWNRIGGVDYTLRFNDHWTSMGQWLFSSTKGDQDNPGYSAGPAEYFYLSRSGHALNLYSYYTDISKGFETQTGYIQSSNLRSDQSYLSYLWFPHHSIVQSYGFETSDSVAFDHDNHRVYHYSSFDWYWTLPRNFVGGPLVGQSSDTLSPESYSALSHYKNITENYGGVFFRGAPWSQFSFKLQALESGNVNYSPASGQEPSLLIQQSVTLSMVLQPMLALTVTNYYLLDRDHAARGGALVYESQTMRSKVNYQFTRALSARVIAEYDSTHANPEQTTLQHTKEFSSQALLTWLPHPGTAIYLGYSNDLQNLDRSLCYRLSSGRCDADASDLPHSNTMLNDGKQIFLKAFYLLRF